MADPRTPSGEALGFREEASPLTDTTDPLSDNYGLTEAPAEEAPPQQQEQTPAPAEPEPQQQQLDTEPPPQESQPQEQPEGEAPPEPSQEQQTEPTPEERKFAGRYNSVEDLEAGYKNIQRLQTRTAEQARAAELRAQQLQAAIESVAPYLQQLQAQGAGVEDPTLEGTGYDPAAIQEQVRQQTARAVAQVQQETLATQVSSAIDSFRASHPDVAPGTPLDTRMAEVILEFQRRPDGSVSYEEFPVTDTNLGLAHEVAKDERLFDMVLELDLRPTQENVEIAREALANPNLAEVLLAQPHLVDTDHGLTWARKQAQIPVVVNRAQAQAQAPSAEEQRKAAYVETGGPGAPQTGAPGQRPPGDEVDEAIAAYRQDRQDSVFFGG